MFLISFIPETFIHLLFLLSISLVIASYFLKLIPFLAVYTSPIRIATFALFISLVFLEGGLNYKHDVDVQVAKDVVNNAKIETKAAVTTTDVAIKYEENIKIIKGKSDEVIKQIPKRISKNDDTCKLSNGYVVLHNAAATNTEVSDPASEFDETTSEIALSTSLSIVAENYKTYHELSEQVISLQEWISKQEAIYNDK